MRKALPFNQSSKRQSPQPFNSERIVERGVPDCKACGDNGVIPIHADRIGEHSVRGVRRDLAAANLRLCLCAMGRFWHAMLEDLPVLTNAIYEGEGPNHA